MSAFGYNESAAQEQFPLTKREALVQGFSWEEYPRGTYGKETLAWDNIPDSIKDFKTTDISKEIFICTACSKNYRIIPDEFNFYKRLEIPLPRLCPDCRHARRFAARGPNKLWKRKCKCAGPTSSNKSYQNTAAHSHASAPCPNEFETSYAPDPLRQSSSEASRPEIVYCESCYNAEVA